MLEGIGLIQKHKKNKIRWAGSDYGVDGQGSGRRKRKSNGDGNGADSDLIEEAQKLKQRL